MRSVEPITPEEARTIYYEVVNFERRGGR